MNNEAMPSSQMPAGSRSLCGAIRFMAMIESSQENNALTQLQRNLLPTD